MFGPLKMNMREIRAEMGLSQSEMAALTGVSVRAIQSYEQGWRKPSETVERVVLLMLIAHRNGAELSGLRCWDHRKDSREICRNCVAFRTQQGHLCWFLTGTMCEGGRHINWQDKLLACLKCEFMQTLLEPKHSKGGKEE